MNEDLKREIIKINGKEINVFIDYGIKDCYISRKEMAYLYDVKPNYISMIINKTGDETSHKLLLVYPVVRKIDIIQKEGNNETKRSIKHYNLNTIKEIGYKLDINITNELIDSVNSLLSVANNSLNKAINYEIVKFNDGEIQLDVNVSPREETVWLTQDQIAVLFEKSRSTITEHINNIFSENELDENTSVGISDVSNSNRKVKIYNLDVILAVGYRVNSKRGIAFRKWATTILKQYLIKGYAFNEQRCLDCTSSIIALQKDVRELQSQKYLSNDNLLKHNEERFESEDLLALHGLLMHIFHLAKKRLIIIDPYADYFLLTMLSNINVDMTIYVSNHSLIKDYVIDNIKIIVKDKIHSRIIISDDSIYCITHSINGLGKSEIILSKIKDLKVEDLI